MQGKLLILRKQHKHTQKDLADFLGIDEGTYRDKELGRSQFKLQEMFDIASFYNKRVDEIFLPTKTTNRGKELV